MSISEEEELIKKSMPIVMTLKKHNIKSQFISLASTGENIFYVEVICLNTEFDVVLDIIIKEMNTVPVIIKVGKKIFTVTAKGVIKNGDIFHVRD